MDRKDAYNKAYSLPILSRLASIVPDSVKPVLRPLYHALKCSRMYRVWARRYFSNKAPRDAILQYWAEPDDSSNPPELYLEKGLISEFLLEIIRRYATTNAKILEIGCNVGRNLNYLFQAGFKDLEGIEISENAVALLKQSYPEMALHTKIYKASVEEIIGGLEDSHYDIVFTTAVLYHIHYDREWIFHDMVRITKDFLITIEDEYAISDWRHFPRNYKKVFQALGMKQVEEIDCGKVAPLQGLYNGFYARVLKKQ